MVTCGSMTLREFLVQHYVTDPENMTKVWLNLKETKDWDAKLNSGDQVAVDWPHVGLRRWTVP